MKFIFYIVLFFLSSSIFANQNTAEALQSDILKVEVVEHGDGKPVHANSCRIEEGNFDAEGVTYFTYNAYIRIKYEVEATQFVLNTVTGEVVKEKPVKLYKWKKYGPFGTGRGYVRYENTSRANNLAERNKIWSERLIPDAKDFAIRECGRHVDDIQREIDSHR